MKNLKDKIRDHLNELTVEHWWDYGDYEEIRDKDYVAECIFVDCFLAAKESEASKNSKIIEYIERKYGIVMNKEDLDNFINREL